MPGPVSVSGVHNRQSILTLPGSLPPCTLILAIYHLRRGRGPFETQASSVDSRSASVCGKAGNFPMLEKGERWSSGGLAHLLAEHLQ